MRILLATPWLFPLGGGLERYAETIARRLEREGHEVDRLGHGERLAPRFTLSNTPLSLAVLREARRRLRERRHDVVSVHSPVPGTAELVAFAARREGIPYVATYHAGRLAGPRGPLAAAARVHAATFERWMLRRAAARIAVSPYVARRALRGLASEVIPPGVDADRFRPVCPPEPGRVLYVGPVSRAYAWKGLAVLARAMDRLPRARLRIVGEGDLAAFYRGRFEVAGRVAEEALAREYSASSVVVLPSLSDAESFGMVLAEANACARPVVATAVGGVPGFVRDGDNGRLVPAGDPRALAEGIAAVLGDPDEARAMGERGRRRVLTEHRWEDLAAQTREVLEAAARAPIGGFARGRGRMRA